MNIDPLSRTSVGAASHAPVTEITDNAAWRVFRQIPDIVNGDDGHFTYIHVSAGVANGYHWPSDTLLAQFGPTSSEGELRTAIVREGAYYYVKLGGEIASDEARLSASMAIAWSRASGRRAWGFTEVDLSTTEIAREAGNLFVADAVGVRNNLANGVEPAELDAAMALADAWYAARREDTLPNLAKLAVGTPVTNGVTMVFTTNHHFQDPHKNVQRAMLNQIYGTQAVDVAGLTKDAFEDAVFHKAFHPIASSRLVWMARSEMVKPRLHRMGLSAAVVRVPAQFQPERALSAYEALINQIREMEGEYNIAIDYDAVMADIEISRQMPSVTASAVVAMEQRVSDFSARRGYGISWLAGLLSALDEDTPREVGRATVLRSHAVKRIIREHPAAAAAGTQHYRMVRRWQRAQANEGQLPGVGLFGAAAPATRGDPAAAEVPL
jgi:hypothetical protein